MTFTRIYSRREITDDIVGDMNTSLGVLQSVPVSAVGSRRFIARQVAGKAVQRTLDATARGDLDVPNELGRFVLRQNQEKNLYTWIAYMVGKGASTFIALL